MSYDHQVTCIINGNEERKIVLNRASLNLYDYTIKKIEGFYDEETIELFNYMINTYIVSTERISEWLKGGTEIDDFEYLDEKITNHKILLHVLRLCNQIRCDIGSEIIAKLISISILKTPESDIERLVNFTDR